MNLFYCNKVKMDDLMKLPLVVVTHLALHSGLLADPAPAVACYGMAVLQLLVLP
jgi:hypothetical protein